MGGAEGKGRARAARGQLILMWPCRGARNKYDAGRGRKGVGGGHRLAAGVASDGFGWGCGGGERRYNGAAEVGALMGRGERGG